jgi:SAM-dependent methyltransferase
MITPEQEQEKYRRMWTEVPGYRSHSPGEELVSVFLSKALWTPTDTLLDAGCGPGRAGLRLKTAGLDVSWLDITKESLDKGVRSQGTFFEGCLWDMELPTNFDWVYCCDVMEHIPPEHVDATLDFLLATARKGTFMQIALWAEGWGNKIGETLHLTVEPAEWWVEKITKRTDILWRDMSNDNRLIVLVGAPLG